MRPPSTGGEQGWHHESLSSLSIGREAFLFARKTDMNAQRSNGRGSTRKRLLTGLRPTGKVHLGNYVGTFEKDLELQNGGEYECFFLIADLHSLTTGYENARAIGEDIREGLLDFLAVGIDPSKSTLYLQSLIPEVSELFLLF